MKNVKKYAEKYTQYGFERNKGYGTKEQRLAIRRQKCAPFCALSAFPLGEQTNCGSSKREAGSQK